VFTGRLKLAKVLLAHQANLHAVDKIGHNVVHFAISSNDLEAVKFCWLHKADFEAKDCMGWTPLLWAVITNADPAIVEFLLANGCQQSAKDSNSLTISQHARLGDRHLVAQLLAKAK
jgi:ankyrin repeat protein